jgi:cation transport regulator
MSYETIDQLPTEIREQLPQDAQQIFVAAFKAASSDGVDEDGAVQIAWNSVKNSFEQGKDNKWHHKQYGDFSPRGSSNMGGG